MESHYPPGWCASGVLRGVFGGSLERVGTPYGYAEKLSIARHRQVSIAAAIRAILMGYEYLDGSLPA